MTNSKLWNVVAITLTGLCVGFLLLATFGSADARRPSPGISKALSPTVLLPAQPPSPRAHAASAYLHLANCRAALTGANGDNDMEDFRVANRQTAWSLGTDYVRYDNTHLGVGSYWYGSPWAGSTYPGGLSSLSYCMGDDSGIVDKAAGTPANW